jgi:hypothetical protein
MAFASFKFAFYGLPNEVSPLLAVNQNGVHAVKRTLWEACRNLLVVYLFSTHAET